MKIIIKIRKYRIISSLVLSIIENKFSAKGTFNIFEINEPANSLILKNKLSDAWINSGCNPQLRDTTFHSGKWCRTVRLFYFKKKYDVVCNGLLNNNCDTSMVGYELTSLQ